MKKENQIFQMYFFNNREHEEFSNVLDYTEKKLLALLKTFKDEKNVKTLSQLIEKYKKGTIAISWKNNLPVYIVIKKEED